MPKGKRKKLYLTVNSNIDKGFITYNDALDYLSINLKSFKELAL